MTRLVLLLVAFGATACESSEPALTDPPGPTAPKVVSVSPAPGQVDVSPFTSVDVTFNKPMSAASFNSSSITLRASGLSVDAATTLAYDPATNKVTITPASPLARAAPYTLTVTTGVRDAAGNPLDSTFVSVFRILDRDVIPPQVMWIAPVSGTNAVSTSSRVALRFSEPMDAATLVDTNIRLATTAGNAAVPASLSVLPGSSTVILTPTAPLSALTNYTVTAGTGLRDGAGNGLSSPVVAAFVTGAGPDLTPPIVVSRNPTDGQTGIALNSFSADVTFSRPMDPTTVNTSGVTISPTPGSLYAVSLIAPAVARVSWGSQLASNTVYKVTVTPGVKDLAGNSVAAPAAGSFTALHDIVPPTIVATQPAANATGVTRNAEIRIFFSEEVEGLGWDDIIITAAGSTVVRTGIGGGGGPEGLFESASFVQFAPNTLHTVSVRVTGVKDKAGNAMAGGPHTFTFTTGQ